MSDGLYAPRALRLETDLGRLARALEDAPRHKMSVPRWVRLLEAFDPGGHTPPTPPAAPGLVVTRAARVEVLRDRAEAGLSLWHEEDVTALEDTGDVAALGLCLNGPLGSSGRQGGVAVSTTLEEDEDAPEPWDVGDDVLTRCARAARDRTPPPPFEAAPARLPFVRPARTRKSRRSA